MRIVRMIVLITAFLLPACAAKKAEKPAPPKANHPNWAAKKLPPPAKPPLADAYGDIPDTVPGTWLVVGSLVLPHPGSLGHPSSQKSGPTKYANRVNVLRISRSDGQWRVEEMGIPKDEPLDSELQKANLAGKPLIPSTEARRHLAAETTTLPVDSPTAERIMLFTPGNLPPTRSGKMHKTKGADFRFALGFVEGGRHVVAAGTTYQADTVTPDKITGMLKATSISEAYRATLIPLTFSGPFTMYRLH